MLEESNLPKIEEPKKSSDSFSERREKIIERMGPFWIVVVAFIILVVIATIAWLIFSGRSNQKTHGDNLLQLSDEERNIDKIDNDANSIDVSIITDNRDIDLTEYDSNIKITKPGNYNLKGILNYSVIINSDSEVTLNLDGVTISSESFPTIINRSTNPLTITLSEDKTNMLTGAKISGYSGVISSNGDLTIKNHDSTDGILSIAGKENSEDGIMANGSIVRIESGRIKIGSVNNGIFSNGAEGGDISLDNGIIMIKAKTKGLYSTGSIKINKGITFIMNESENTVIDAGGNFYVNGGTFFATSMTTPKKPLSDSEQKTLAINLDKVISDGSEITIKNKTTGLTKLMQAESDLKALLYSSSDLTSGDYEIIVNDETYGTGVLE